MNSTHLGCRSDDGLQCCRWPWGIAGVTAGVVCAVVVVIVTVRGGTLQQVLPACRRLRLGVEGGGGGQRSWRWRGGGGGTQDRGHPAQKPGSSLDLFWLSICDLHSQNLADLFWPSESGLIRSCLDCQDLFESVYAFRISGFLFKFSLNVFKDPGSGLDLFRLSRSGLHCQNLV